MNKESIYAVLIGFALVAMTGCTKPGPAESAGARIDDAASDAQDRLDAAGDEIEEASEDVGDALRGN